MLFWTGILFAAFFAYFAIKLGFYQMWAIMFNLVISVYLAFFLMSVVSDVTGVGGDSLYGSALMLLTISVVVFVILQGISYIFITGQFEVSFPKIFDVLGSGFLGSLAGFLVWSFISLLICITPFSRTSFAKTAGLGNDVGQINVRCVSWWCDMVGRIAAKADVSYTTEQVIGELLEAANPKPKPRPQRIQPTVEQARPNDINTIEQERPGPPPEADL